MSNRVRLGRQFAGCVLFTVMVTPVLAQVSSSRLANNATDDGNWLMYSGSYSSLRFSPLDQISTDNVGRLKPLWVYQPPGSGSLEATPVVADGVMYMTSGPASVVALDLRSGNPLWQWSRPIAPTVLNLGFPRVNRGVAIFDSLVYVGTLDGYLVALDARTGVQRWIVPVGDNPSGHAITAAPLVADGKVIVGISGGEAGIRGYLDVYDAQTGKRVWRMYTVPSPGEPGSDTWAGDSWVHGAGATWLTGSYDPALKLLYWGTGNPGPDWNGDARQGDNLFTCSLLAIDVDTGRMRWHFQFTPHDVHDWDANQIPVLVNAEFGGRARSLVVMANRNGFFYVLDRTTGEYLLGTVYAKQTWARGLDAKGRPLVIPNMEPSEKGTLVYPSLQGSTNWSSPSYSPMTGMLYVPVREMDRFTTNRRSSIGAGRISRAAAKSGSTKNRGVRCARSTSRPAMRRGTSSCRPRRGPASWRPPAVSCSADRTKATSMRSTRRPAHRCGSSRPEARSVADRCLFCPKASSAWPCPEVARSSCSGSIRDDVSSRAPRPPRATRKKRRPLLRYG